MPELRPHKKGLDWTREIFKSAFKPTPRIPIWQWLEKHVMVPTITGSPRPGRYRSSSAPIMRRWFEAYQDPKVRFISFAKSARSGGTVFAILIDLWVICNSPGPIAWLFPNVTSGREFSQRDYQPFIRACKETEALRGKTKESWTRVFMVFRDCIVKLVGSGSPTAISGFNAEHFRIDEVDKLLDIPGKEAPPAELALSRMRLYPDTGKCIRSSTPTLSDALAWKYFLRGSREYYYIPCPHDGCGCMQRLTFFPEDRIDEHGEIVRDELGNPRKTGQMLFGHLKSDAGTYEVEALKSGVVYECQEETCKGHIAQSQLQELLLDARSGWLKHNPKHPQDELSGHICALYFPAFSKWWEITQEWIRNKDTPGGRQYFFNQILGLPFEHSKTTLTVETIKHICKLSPKYKRCTLSNNKLPFKPALIAMQVDVQGESSGMWWTIILWDENWNMYLLDWASKEARGFDDLDVLLKRVFTFEGGVFGITQCAIDSGHRTSHVYDWCEQNAPICFPFKGGTGGNGANFRPAIEVPVENRDLTLVHFLDKFFKGVLYQQRMAFRSGRGFYLPEWESKEGLEDGVDQVLVAQITNERCDQYGEWVGVTAKRPDNNHLGDCLKMAMVEDYQFDLARRLGEQQAEEEKEERERMKRNQ